MVITFENGTARQHALFNAAMDESLFPWDRISTRVTVKWAGKVTIGHNSFAFTTWDTTATDPCGRPDVATIEILDNLDDPNRPGTEDGWPKGWFAGDAFFKESVIHELGHVVQSKFSVDQITRMSAVFDGTYDEWGGSENTGKAWQSRRQESYAETFKDVWLPRPNRKFNNRTGHVLLPDRFETFLEVLDGICPCATASTFLTSDGGGGGILT